MKLTNDCYVIFIHTRSATERYSRDGDGWLKVSTRGRKFRATAEQVLNHLLPVLAGVKRHVSVEVQYRNRPRQTQSASGLAHSRTLRAAR